jgi:hypothetical protein
MATTDLKLDEPGTLMRPGPIGRGVRLALGFLCLWYVLQLLGISGNLLDSEGHIRQLIWNGIIIGLFLISYVINIGFSRDWKKWPALVSGAAFLAIGGIGFLLQGKFETPTLAVTIWLWELYLFSHLGISFGLAGLIGSPGCEMRAFHRLFSMITGKPTKEHVCPVGPLHSVDQWEGNRKTQ